MIIIESIIFFIKDLNVQYNKSTYLKKIFFKRNIYNK